MPCLSGCRDGLILTASSEFRQTRSVRQKCWEVPSNLTSILKNQRYLCNGSWLDRTFIAMETTTSFCMYFDPFLDLQLIKKLETWESWRSSTHQTTAAQRQYGSYKIAEQKAWNSALSNCSDFKAIHYQNQSARRYEFGTTFFFNFLVL